MYFSFYDPLEQFLIQWFNFWWFLKVSNLNFIWLVAFLLIVIFLNSLTSTSWFLKNSYKYVTSMIIQFVRSVIQDNVQTVHLTFFPWFLILFFLILFFNLFGMVPFTFTVTSSLITTFFYALAFFISLNIIGIMLHRFNFIFIFLPSGTPLLITPFLIIIEILSYFARVFSLSIRLFANLMSGHTLLHILAGVAWSQVTFGFSRISFVLFPGIVIFLITGLETVIGIMQAYVFLILLSIYLSDVITLH